MSVKEDVFGVKQENTLDFKHDRQSKANFQTTDLLEQLGSTYVLITPSQVKNKDGGAMRTGEMLTIPAEIFLNMLQSLLAVRKVETSDAWTETGNELLAQTAEVGVNTMPPLEKRDVGLTAHYIHHNAGSIEASPTEDKAVSTEKITTKNVTTLTTSLCEIKSACSQTDAIATNNVSTQIFPVAMKHKQTETNKNTISKNSVKSKTVPTQTSPCWIRCSKCKCYYWWRNSTIPKSDGEKSRKSSTTSYTSQNSKRTRSTEPSSKDLQDVLSSVQEKVSAIKVSDYNANANDITNLDPMQYIDCYLLLLSDFIHYSKGTMPAFKRLLENIVNHILLLTSYFKNQDSSTGTVIALDQSVLLLTRKSGKWDFNSARHDVLCNREKRKANTSSPVNQIRVISEDSTKRFKTEAYSNPQTTTDFTDYSSANICLHFNEGSCYVPNCPYNHVCGHCFSPTHGRLICPSLAASDAK